MYRVELKERHLECFRKIRKFHLFLMYRVELKGLRGCLRFLPRSGFLMYRVELKEEGLPTEKIKELSS